MYSVEWSSVLDHSFPGTSTLEGVSTWRWSGSNSLDQVLRGIGTYIATYETITEGMVMDN